MRLIPLTITILLVLGFIVSSVSHANSCEPILVKTSDTGSEIYVTLRNIKGAFKYKGEYYILLENGATLIVSAGQFKKILAKVKEVY